MATTPKGMTVSGLRKRVQVAEVSQAEAAWRAGEIKARGDGDTANAAALAVESQARAAADAAEAKLRADEDARLVEMQADEGARLGKAMADEAKARSEADAALTARQVRLSGTLSLPASLALLAGKSVRTVTVAGLKAGDDVTVTPKAALPAGVALGEAYCLSDGVLSLALVTVTLVTIATKTDVPLGVVALR